MCQDKEIKSSFFDYMLASNRPELGVFKKWIFHPGMLFNSPAQWWGNRKQRSAPHEGLDLCSFEDASGQIKQMDKNINIPATFAGEIIKIDHDFLGKSIYLRHEIFSEDGRQLYTAYGHTKPHDSVGVGKQVAEGEVIATISDFPGKKTDILPHLHLTFAWIPAAIHPDRLNWQTLSRDPAITLLDPLAVLAVPLGSPPK